MKARKTIIQNDRREQSKFKLGEKNTTSWAYHWVLAVSERASEVSPAGCFTLDSMTVENNWVGLDRKIRKFQNGFLK